MSKKFPHSHRRRKQSTTLSGSERAHCNVTAASMDHHSNIHSTFVLLEINLQVRSTPRVFPFLRSFNFHFSLVFIFYLQQQLSLLLGSLHEVLLGRKMRISITYYSNAHQKNSSLRLESLDFFGLLKVD